MKNNELVSVVINTYNQEKYIKEALDSVYNQTYENIELIITDNASQDKNVEIIEKWLKEYGQRFIKIVFITGEVNIDICRNWNKAIPEANGEYIKHFYGDDILIEYCIEKFVNYMEQNKEVNIVFGRVLDFFNNDRNNYLDYYKEYKIDLKYFDKNVKGQLIDYIKYNPLSSPGCFFRRSIFQKYGLFDETMIIDDAPFLLNLLKNGEKFYFLDTPVCLYRRHNSFSAFNSDGLQSQKMYEGKLQIYDKYVYPNFKLFNMFWKIHLVITYSIYRYLLKHGITKKNYNKIKFLKLFDIISIKAYLKYKLKFVKYF